MKENRGDRGKFGKRFHLLSSIGNVTLMKHVQHRVEATFPVCFTRKVRPPSGRREEK